MPNPRTHERDHLFGPDTCQLNDPCYFRLSDRHGEQHGKVVGRTFGRIRFDVRGDDGLLYGNIENVRLDHEAVGVA